MRSFVLLILMSCSGKVDTSNYYFDAKLGNDINNGNSKEQAFKTLSKIAELSLRPGDSLFLKNGQSFRDAIQIKNQNGSKALPIVITSYSNSSNNKPLIETKGALEGILISNSNYIVIKNLEISALPKKDAKRPTKKMMRHGVLVHITQPMHYKGIHLENLFIHDVFFEKEGFTRPKKEVKTENGTQNYGGGIRFLVTNKKAKLTDISIDSCRISNVSHTGIKLTSHQNTNVHGIENFLISNSTVFKSGGPGIQMSGVKNGHIYGNTTSFSGSADDSRKWGRGSGLWTWGSDRVLIEKNTFEHANGPGDSAGAHIDFNCSNVVLQYNLSRNNAGGFCEILGNNYNCAYRYNISINDGHRIKGKNGAFQEGKTLWLSGYTGKKKKRKGPFNSYIYNNTIVVDKTIQPKIAFNNNASGVLIANNIFHIAGKTKIVKGDQYNPQKNGTILIDNVLFKNNLFLGKHSWPKNFAIKDENPIYGNAGFRDKNGAQLSGLTPTNQSLIKNKGIIIPRISKDSIGLVYGLHLKFDILGNPITDNPDLGAIELVN